MLAGLATLAVALAVEAAHEGGKSGGLPQLNPHDFSPQLFWLAVSFVVLYFLMAKVALPRVGGIIEDRRQRIQRDLDDAERLKAKTEKALADYETSMANARQRSSGIAKEIRDKLAAEVESERAKVDGQVSARIADAEKQIAAMKTKALADVGQIAAETATAIVGQLTGKQVSSTEAAKAVTQIAGE